jgi:hypothetical protein
MVAASSGATCGAAPTVAGARLVQQRIEGDGPCTDRTVHGCAITFALSTLQRGIADDDHRAGRRIGCEFAATTAIDNNKETPVLSRAATNRHRPHGCSTRPALRRAAPRPESRRPTPVDCAARARHRVPGPTANLLRNAAASRSARADTSA